MSVQTWMSIALIATVGCATPYQKRTFWNELWVKGGFSDQRVGDNEFRVRFDSTIITKVDTLNAYLLYRCAELTIEDGKDYFIVRDGSFEDSTGTVVTMALLTGVATTAFKSGAVTIQTFNGTKPDSENAFDAREVMKRLGPRVGRSS